MFVLLHLNVSNISVSASAGGSDITAVLPSVNQSFPGDVEAEANSYFQKIYNQPPNPTMTIDEVLEMLKKFKDSSSKKEKVGVKCREFFFGYSLTRNVNIVWLGIRTERHLFLILSGCISVYASQSV